MPAVCLRCMLLIILRRRRLYYFYMSVIYGEYLVNVHFSDIPHTFRLPVNSSQTLPPTQWVVTWWTRHSDVATQKEQWTYQLITQWTRHNEFVTKKWNHHIVNSSQWSRHPEKQWTLVLLIFSSPTLVDNSNDEYQFVIVLSATYLGF